MNTKIRRIFTEELKSGHPHGVFCPSSIPSEYLFLCARRKFGFNKKIWRNLLIFYVYYQPNSCTTHAEHEWAGGTFQRQRKKFLQPMRSGCMFCTRGTTFPPPSYLNLCPQLPSRCHRCSSFSCCHCHCLCHFHRAAAAATPAAAAAAVMATAASAPTAAMTNVCVAPASAFFYCCLPPLS
jgi:hypothetical protein